MSRQHRPPREDVLGPLEEALSRYRSLGWPEPAAALVSGSGLAVDLGGPVHGPVPLQELLPFPIHGIVGHPLQVELLLPVPDRPVLYFRGRLHSYQGYTAAQTVMPVRLARLLGASTLVMTNASGGLATTVQHGQTGIVLPEGSPPSAYADAIIALSADQKRYQAYRMAARKRFDERLNWERAGERLFELIKEVNQD